MEETSPRARMIGRILMAHIVGLWVAGMAGSIGTTAGFGFLAGFLGLFLGGLLSLPWIAVSLVTVWFRAPFLERHPVWFTALGSLAVTATWTLLTGPMWQVCAISCVASSVCYLMLWFWGHRKQQSALVAKSG